MRARRVERRPRARRGVTLVEIMTVSALFLVLLSGLVATGINAAGEYSRGTAKVLADDQASRGIQKMCREIRNGVTATLNSSSDISVAMPYVNAQGDFDRYVAGSTIRYYYYNGKVYRQVDAAASTVFISGVTALSFVVENTPTGLRYRIALTCQQQNGKNTKSTTLTTTLALRNEQT